MARVAKCFQRHGWAVVKRHGSTLDVRQAGDEVDLTFSDRGIHFNILGDAIANRAAEECTLGVQGSPTP
jgi:hypothetical protein